MRTSLTPRALWLGGALVLGLLAVLGSTGPTLADAANGHPAKIHEGTCEALGRVAFSLTGVGASVDVDQTPIATPVPVNPESSYQILISETTIPAPMETVLSGQHAVMVYDTDKNQQVLACGNIGGAIGSP